MVTCITCARRRTATRRRCSRRNGLHASRPSSRIRSAGMAGYTAGPRGDRHRHGARADQLKLRAHRRGPLHRCHPEQRIDARLDPSAAFAAPGTLRFADRVEKSDGYVGWVDDRSLARTKRDELFRMLRVPRRRTPSPSPTPSSLVGAICSVSTRSAGGVPASRRGEVEPGGGGPPRRRRN